MPIKSLIENQQNKAEFSIGRDVELSLCSDACLLCTLDDSARVVRTGQVDASALTVILGEDRLLVPVAGVARAGAHVLGAQNGQASARANWEKLIGRRHPALMSVYRVCDCMAEIQILDGEEFEDAATTPAWKKVRGIVTKPANSELKTQPLAFDQWRAWMGDLAQGLAELESLGLAHGDPYPFNAVCHAQRATWVDFGHMTDDPDQRFKDAWAFVLFTVMHTLGKSAAYSPSLLRELAAALAQAGKLGRFERIRDALLQPYDDLIFVGDLQKAQHIFVTAVVEQSDKVFSNLAVPELLIKASIQYFSAFLHHIQRGNQYLTAFQVERQRHRFQEEEMLRLTVPRAEHLNRLGELRRLVAQKDEHIADLNQAVIKQNSQLIEFTQCAAQSYEQNASIHQSIFEHDLRVDKLHDALDEHSASLHRLIAERDLQANQLRRELDGQSASHRRLIEERDYQANQLRHELDALFKRYEQVLHSRSWRLTRPLRNAARFYPHSLNYAKGRQALYRIAAKISRTLPFPLWLKVRVHAALVAKPQPINPGQNIERALNSELSPKFDHDAKTNSISMRPECCGLIENLVSIVLPVYNQADLIVESIDSVLNQTYQNFELIIINDGSTDGVESVLERYQGHPKIRCYKQTNQRLPKALSNGFDFARGEFRTWTSADNIMEPKMLEQLVSKLREDPKLGMVFADYYAIDDRGSLLQDWTWRAHNRPIPASAEIRLPRTTENLNTVQDNFIGPCFMYRGWVGQCIGDYDTQLGIEDYDYWMRINAFFEIRHLGSDSLLYRYRVHDNTLSAQAKEHKILDKALLLMEYEKERAAYYQSSLSYVADGSGADWLKVHGVSEDEIIAFEDIHPENAVFVLGCDAAEEHLAKLLRTRRPVAILLGKTDIRYHKLHRLLSSGHCVALIEDRISAERVRLISSGPMFDAKSALSLTAVCVFSKNFLFVRTKCRSNEITHAAPHLIRPRQSRHVLLQVDDFMQGGMENVVIDLGLSLKTCGYRVTIANLGKSGDAAAKAEEHGLKVESFSANRGEDTYLSWLKSNHVDLVNAHYSVYGVAACRDAGIPFVQTIHNSYVWLDAEQIAKYREADRHTAQYLCVSMTAARYADVALGLSVGKMRVVPNGIDPSTINATHFSENRQNLRKTWGVGAQTPVFINVASIMATKAQLPLVKAFARVIKQVPSARLILLGTPMEALYHKAVRNAVRDLNLQGNVLFAGYERNVAPFYHAADIFVLPSYWEGWSLSLGEAMANGLACVITDVGSAYEFEDRDNVEVVAPPFGDITMLNHQNLGQFVSGDDSDFEERLANAMVKLARYSRNSVNQLLAESLDRNIAYGTYADIFASI